MSDLMPWMAPWSGRITALVLLAVGLWLMWRGWRCGRRHTVPHCPRCQYNLTGSVSGSCPECGFVPRRPDDRFHGRRRYRLVIFGLIVAFALPVFVVQHRVRQYGWEYYAYYGPWYWISPNKTIEELHVFNTSFEVLQDRRPWNLRHTLVVKQEGRLMHAFNEYKIQLESQIITVPYGSREFKIVSVRAYSGGAHCCTDFHLFSVNEWHVKPIQTIEARHSSVVEWRDLNDDSIPEIIVPDWTFEYWPASFASSPVGHVVLSSDGWMFHPSPALMHREPPRADSLESQAKTFAAMMTRQYAEQDDRLYGGQYAEIFQTMVDLIYTGHADLARFYFNVAWHHEVPGKAEALEDFQAILRTSPYYGTLVQLNGGELSLDDNPP